MSRTSRESGLITLNREAWKSLRQAAATIGWLHVMEQHTTGARLLLYRGIRAQTARASS